jgi:tripartite-type tricarboxylate transporter receptor subunit TctC
MSSRQTTRAYWRRVFSAAVVLVLSGAMPAMAWEPTKPVRIVVHTPAGSGADVFARAVVDAIKKEKLISVAVEVVNQPGAGGLNAMNYTAQQAGDPHYLMAITNVIFSTPLRQKSKLTYKDFTPVMILAEDSNALQVNAKKYKAFSEFVAAAKTLPKAVSHGVGSIGGTDHMIGHALGKAIGAEFNVVAFDGGGDAAVAVLGGHADFVTGGPSETKGQINAGLLRVLAVFGDERLESFPDVPTLKELGVNMSAPFAVIRGFVGPKDMPAEAVKYYANVLEKVTQTEQWKAFARNNDFVATKVGPDKMGDFLSKRSDAIAETLTAMGVLK